MSAPEGVTVWLKTAVLPWLSSLDWHGIAGSVFLSLAASALFWVLTFKLSLTDVRFSPKLEKSPSATGKPYHRYRIRFTNLGRRDLFEVSVVVRMRIQLRTTTQIMYLNCGDQNFLPVLCRWPSFRSKASPQVPTLAITPSDSMLRELTKTFYTSHIRSCAQNGKISLDDLFQEYGDRIQLEIFVYGTDRVTGARRMFTSPVYTVSNVEEGRFRPTKKISRPRLKRKRAIETQYFHLDPPKQ